MRVHKNYRIVHVLALHTVLHFVTMNRINNVKRKRQFYMYNEQTNTHFIDSLLYCSLFIVPTCFNANASSSGSSYSRPAKLRKDVHAPPRLHKHIM
jgi:hypothetical protein